MTKMTSQEERELFIAYRDDRCIASRDKLLNAQMGLIINNACHFTTNVDLRGELINEGVIGFLTYLSKFNPYRGFRLSTYINMPVVGAMLIYIQQNSDLLGAGYKLRTHAFMKHLVKEDHHSWSHNDVLRFANKHTAPLDKVLAVIGCYAADGTLDYEYCKNKSVLDTIIDDDIRNKVYEFAMTFSIRESRIFCDMILNNKSTQTTAKNLGISASRVNQIVIKLRRDIVEMFDLCDA